MLAFTCDRGIYDALNKGINAATGDVVGFLHADDFFAHDQVLEQIAGAFIGADIAGIYGDLQYVRKPWYSRIGGFDTQYRIAADYFSMLQLFGNPEFKAAYIPEVLVKMCVGGASNRSLGNIVRKSQEDLDALRRSGVGGFGTLVGKNIRKVGQFW